MKKILLLIGLFFFLTGCTKNEAKNPVIDYLELYRNHSNEVESSLDELIRDEDLLEGQQDIYRFIMKKQYVHLEYKIQDIIYNGNTAVVQAFITVYDYQHAKDEAKEEMESNLGDYLLEDGSIDIMKYKNLQLEKMKKETERIHYTIHFKVKLENETWTLETPDYTVLQKLHGIYNYNLIG